MATKQQIEYVFSNIVQSTPAKFLHLLSGANEGIGFVLNRLYEANRAVSCGELSEQMGVSNARVAVLVKKLVTRNLVLRENSKDDGRIAMVRLTKQGEAVALAMQKEMQEHIARIIDEVGMQKLEQFIELSQEIKNAAETVVEQCEFDM